MAQFREYPSPFGSKISPNTHRVLSEAAFNNVTAGPRGSTPDLVFHNAFADAVVGKDATGKFNTGRGGVAPLEFARAYGSYSPEKLMQAFHPSAISQVRRVATPPPLTVRQQQIRAATAAAFSEAARQMEEAGGADELNALIAARKAEEAAAITRAYEERMAAQAAAASAGASKKTGLYIAGGLLIAAVGYYVVKRKGRTK